MIIDVNKQRIDSTFIELFIIHDAYFTTHHESVVFRDSKPPFTQRTYLPLPIEFTGIEHKSDGAYARPRLVVANVLETFKDAIGVTTEDLIGKKLTRRKLLEKHLNSGSSVSPPIEFPVNSYIIDRKENENAISITFELASPFDVAGINLPSRYIIPNTCAWAYQGDAPDGDYKKTGACGWRVSSNNNGFPVYLDSRDNLFITVDPPTHGQSGAFTQNFIYAVAGNKTRVNLDNSFSSVSRPEYFQARISSAGPLNNNNSRRCIKYSNYSHGTTYHSYVEGYLFNDYVLYENRIWRCIKTNVSVTPKNGEYWIRADICSKKLPACIARFGSTSTSAQFSNIPSIRSDESKTLPYGGFPATRRFTR